MPTHISFDDIMHGGTPSVSKLVRLLNEMGEAIQQLQRLKALYPLSLLPSVGGNVLRIDLPDKYLQFAVRSQTDDLLRCVPYEKAKLPGDQPQLYDSGLGLAYLLDESGDPLLDGSGHPLHDESTLAGPVVWVAKPYLLQQTPWNAQTVSLANLGHNYTYARTGNSTRDATDETAVTTHQVVYPDYFPGDVVLALKADTGYQDEDGKDVEWMEVNTGGRAWITLCP